MLSASSANQAAADTGVIDVLCHFLPSKFIYEVSFCLSCRTSNINSVIKKTHNSLFFLHSTYSSGAADLCNHPVFFFAHVHRCLVFVKLWSANKQDKNREKVKSLQRLTDGAPRQYSSVTWMTALQKATTFRPLSSALPAPPPSSPPVAHQVEVECEPQGPFTHIQRQTQIHFSQKLWIFQSLHSDAHEEINLFRYFFNKH